MKRKEFLSRLIGEISGYILESNPLRMVISLHQEEDGAHIIIFDDKIRDKNELQEIRKALNPTERRPELAEYYGMMAGRDAAWDTRLKLVGWQIKKATVENNDSGTQIELWLGEDSFNPANFTM